MSDGDDRRPDTRTLMAASAVFMGVVGLAAVFFPQEILSPLGHPPAGSGWLLFLGRGGGEGATCA